MRLEIISTLVKKDVEDIYRSKRILLSSIGFPLFMGILFPAFIILSTIIDTSTSQADSDVKKMSELLNLFPYFSKKYGSLPLEHQVIVFTVHLVVMFSIFILTTSLPLFIAADSIAGEKERKTLEVMLSVPITKMEYIIGKVLTAWIPSLIIMGGISIGQVILIDVITFPTLKFFLLPNMIYLYLLVLISPTAGLLAIAITVHISSRSNSVREAEQLSGFGLLILYPIVGIQVILFLLEPLQALVLSVMTFALALAILRMSTNSFEGEKILRRI